MSSAQSAAALVQDFQDDISSHRRLLGVPTALEDVRRDCAIKMLQSIATFLISWEGFNRSDGGTFPSGIIRDAFSLLYSELGRGDTQIRSMLLETLSAVTTTDGRQILLDALPYAMPMENSSSDLENATQQVLETLRGILMQDSSALLPVVGCLYGLPLSVAGRSEAWNVALAALPVVEQCDLPVLVQTLLRHVSTSEDASRALKAVRAEFHTLQSIAKDRVERRSDDPSPVTIHVLLGALRDLENGTLLSAAYVGILRSVVEEQDQESFLLLDVATMLVVYKHPDFQDDVISLMDEMAIQGMFPFDSLSHLLALLGHRRRPGEPTSLLYDALTAPLLSIGISLLLSPVRLKRTAEETLAGAHDFLLELHHNLDRERQEELVRCLLHLSEEASWYGRHDEAPATTRSRKRSRSSDTKLPRNQDNMQLTVDHVHKVLQSLARTARGSLVRFKHILIERFTSTTSMTTTRADVRSIQQLCALLSCLIEPAHAEAGCGSGIDASELLILLQKLLFTSSFGRVDRALQTEDTFDDICRVVRGLLLATELVKSPSLQHGDKQCIAQWALRILLPPTRRTVDPEIGRHGLHFLSTWSQFSSDSPLDRNTADMARNASLFENVKLIIANTGLVQRVAVYLEGEKQTNHVVLGYSRIPEHFVRSEASTSTSYCSSLQKKGSIVFCVDSFLRNTSIPRPARWGEMAKWVFDLVDQYLSLGRNSKWLPDRWLEASIELPMLQMSAGKTTKKARNAEEGLVKLLNNFDVSELCKLTQAINFADVANSIVDGQSMRCTQEKVQLLLRYGLACCLSVNLSAAVLRNSHSHFQTVQRVHESTGKFQSDSLRNRRQEILKLMQYQLLKIYDLIQKCQTVASMLRALVPAVLRSFPPAKIDSDTHDVHDRDELMDGDDCQVEEESDGANTWSNNMTLRTIATIERASESMLLALSLTGDPAEPIDESLAWKCLNVADDDSLLADTTDPNPQGSSFVLTLRTKVIDDLSRLFRSRFFKGQGIKLSLEFLNGIEHSATMAVKLLGLLPEHKEGDTTKAWDTGGLRRVRAASISCLVASSFRLLSTSLACCRQCTRSKNSEETIGIARICEKAFKLDELDSGEDGIHEQLGDTAFEDGNQIVPAFNNVLKRLKRCEDEFVALEILDVLAVLAWRAHPELINHSLDASWRVLHTIFCSIRLRGSQTSLLPFAFQQTVERFVSKVDCQDETTHPTVQQVLSATVVKSSLRSTKEFIECSNLRRTLLAVWGLMMHPWSAQSRIPLYLSKLVCELDAFLSAFDSPKEIRPTWNSAFRRQRTPSASGGQRKTSIPGLSASSFVVYYEMVLHLVVASFAASPHACSAVGQDEKKRENPYDHLQEILDLFGSLIDVYTSRFRLFPRRMVTIIVASCKHLLNVCVYHIRGCVQWRNEQPVLMMEQKKAGMHDIGSIRYIARLLQTFTTFGARKIISICEFVRSHCQSLAMPGSEEGGGGEAEVSVGMDIRGATWLVAAHHSKFVSLVLAAQKMAQVMRDVAKTHNLILPQIQHDLRDSAKRTFATAALVENDRGFHEVGKLDVAPPTLSFIDRKEKTQQGKRCRMSPTLVDADEKDPRSHKRLCRIILEDDDQSLLAENKLDPNLSDVDEQSLDSRETFQVSGHWGDDERALDVHSDNSTGSLELDVTEIMKAS